jgi:hypothetical protein
MGLAPVVLVNLFDSLVATVQSADAAAATPSMQVGGVDEPGRAGGRAGGGCVGWSCYGVRICGLDGGGGERCTLGMCLQCLLKLCLQASVREDEG